MTLVEVMIGMGVGSLVLLVLASLTVYSSKSLCSLVNYTDLNQGSRMALDIMTKEIRQSRGLISRTPTSLEFRLDQAGTKRLVYVWDKSAKTFSQVKMGFTNVLLNDCTYWTNTLFQRTPTYNSWGLIAASTPVQAKLIQLNWVCARDRVNATNSESVQSMRIVIRKKVN